MIPAQRRGAARCDGMPSGILKVKYWWARMWEAQPPWASEPSSYLALYVSFGAVSYICPRCVVREDKKGGEVNIPTM